MEAAAPLQAGVARTAITPPVGAMLVGFPDPQRQANGIRDPLYATALVLDDGRTRTAIVSCDLVYVHPTIARLTGTLVQQQTGIPAAQVLICCSHTHSGPPACDHPEARSVDRAYVAILPYLLAGTVSSAAAQLEPVQLNWGTAPCAVGINRREKRPDGRVVLGRNPGGPVDPLVRVARLDRLEDASPLALLVNYACHPVTLGGSSRQVSADYVGHMRTAVEQATAGSVLFLQGACGDINPRLGPGPDDGSVRALGLELAGAVLTACATAKPLRADSGLAAAAEVLDLQMMEDTSVIPDLISDEERRTLYRDIALWEPWLAEWSTDAEGKRIVPIEMRALRIGELALVTIPVEPFVEIGLALQEARPDQPTMVAGYTNGCVGYTPMPYAYPQGGYEVSHSWIYPRLPGPLAPESAGSIIDAGKVLLAHVG